MARSTKPSAGQNTVADLTEEDLEALQHHFEMKIATAEAEAAEAAAAAKTKKKAVGNLFKMVTAELGYTREKFETYLLDKRRSPEEFEANEEQRRKMYARGGMDIGEQGVLNLGDSADDKARAERDGFEAGKAAKDPIPPGYISPIFHSDWMAQWHKGQERNIMLLGKAEALLASRDAAAAKGDLQADNDPGGEDEEDFDPEAEAKKLKKSGFLDTAEAEAEADLAGAA